MSWATASSVLRAMKLVLGIDAGASKTECLLADDEGHVLAKARGPGANFHLFDEEENAHVLKELATKVLKGYGPRADVLCVGMAGADRDAETREMQRILKNIRVAEINVVTNDALIALVAGCGERYGVTLIVGTGATAYGVNRRGEVGRAGGWGHLLGDEGSGYWMGLRSLRSVVRAEDGRGQKTLLTALVLERMHARRVDELIPRVYGRSARDEIASLASLVQQAADRGDAAAQEIIDEAGREFLRAVESVIGRLGLAGEAFRLVLSGGLWRAVPVLADDLGVLTRKIAPWCEVIRLRTEPARGAVQIALEAARARR